MDGVMCVGIKAVHTCRRILIFGFLSKALLVTRLDMETSHLVHAHQYLVILTNSFQIALLPKKEVIETSYCIYLCITSLHVGLHTQKE